MRTLLNEVAAIENYLLNKNVPDEQLLFEAKLIIDPQLQEKVTAQRQTYQLVKQYGRKQLKAELEAVYKKLNTEPAHQSFMKKINRIFGLS